MEEEIWKDIKGYEGCYQVSNLGRVRSLDRYVRIRGNARRLVKGHVLSPSSNGKGYLQILLWNSNKWKMKYIHRLVAESFVPNPNNLPQVNHKDEDKSNNRVENLEWCDESYNINYGTAMERMAEKRRGVPLDKLSKTVFQYTLDNQFVRAWQSTCECRRNGFHQGSVAACCRNERHTHKGFRWSYKKM